MNDDLKLAYDIAYKVIKHEMGENSIAANLIKTQRQKMSEGKIKEKIFTCSMRGYEMCIVDMGSHYKAAIIKNNEIIEKYECALNILEAIDSFMAKFMRCVMFPA